MIRAALHFTDTEQRNDDRLYKIRPILDIVKDLYTSVYKSDKEICIDETMIRFKGRLFFKQYLPSKRVILTTATYLDFQCILGRKSKVSLKLD